MFDIEVTRVGRKKDDMHVLVVEDGEVVLKGTLSAVTARVLATQIAKEYEEVNRDYRKKHGLGEFADPPQPVRVSRAL